VLIEHCAGNFPLWLTPEQALILPISEKYNDYSKKVSQLLKNYDIRAAVDERDERAGKKIRDAEISKVPYMLIVGEKEEQSGTVSVRKHGEGDLGTLSLEAFAGLVNDQISSQIDLNIN